jgi:hypothetical protein
MIVGSLDNLYMLDYGNLSVVEKKQLNDFGIMSRLYMYF